MTQSTEELLSDARERERVGQFRLALESYSAAVEQADVADQLREALVGATESCLQAGLAHEAVVWAQRLRRETDAEILADVLEASGHVLVGEPAAALALLDGIGPAEAGHTVGAARVELLRTQAHYGAGQLASASASLVRTLSEDVTCPGAWRLLAVLGQHPEVELDQVLDLLPEDRFGETLGELVEAPVGGVDRVLEALWQRSGGDARALVIMQYRGSELPLERALVWSSRLRAAGQSEECPVLGLSANERRGARERVRATAAAYATYADARAATLLPVAVDVLRDDELQPAFEEIATLAPDLIEEFIVAAAATPGRSLRTAASLAAMQQFRPAVALIRHARGLTSGRDTLATVLGGLGRREREQLAQAACEQGAEDLVRQLRPSV